MLRHVSRFAAVCLLIAVVHYRPAVSTAWDDVKPGPPQEAEKSKTYDDEEFADPHPAAPHADPATTRPGQDAQSSMPRAAHQERRTITAALVWLANHQSADGSWSLHNYTRRCTDGTCKGQSDISSDAGATALGLLPFLGRRADPQVRRPVQSSTSSRASSG